MRWRISGDTGVNSAKEVSGDTGRSIRGERIVLILIFLITGIVSFAYVHKQLESSERYQGTDVEYITPAPDQEEER